LAHAATAREQEFAGLLSRGSKVVIDSLARLVVSSNFTGRVATGRYVLDLENHHVAATQLAVDGQIKHGEVARSRGVGRS
jgi:hypothetical protein